MVWLCFYGASTSPISDMVNDAVCLGDLLPLFVVKDYIIFYCFTLNVRGRGR